MQNKTFTVQVLHTEDEYQHLSYKNLTTKTKKHLIEENQLEIMDNQLELDMVFFKHWFAKSIEEEKKRMINEYLSNIPLIWANREVILKEPKYYSVAAAISLTYHEIIDLYGISGYPIKVRTLGELLQIWMNEEIMSAKCEKCGGQAVFYTVGLSSVGKPWGHTVCLQCGKLGTGKLPGLFTPLREIIHKYKPIEPIAENPVSFGELVEVLKKLLETNGNDKRETA